MEYETDKNGFTSDSDAVIIEKKKGERIRKYGFALRGKKYGSVRHQFQCHSEYHAEPKAEPKFTKLVDKGREES